jgi:hypothetical protein
MKYFFLFLFGLIAPQQLLCQKKAKLPKELNEISGLEKFNDSILVAINDSGNTPDIYFIDLKGTILRKSRVTNATNTDWEDLAMDDMGNLYIADVGNNLNQRRDLCIWKVRITDAFAQDSVSAQKISYCYQDQAEFPPKEEAFRFDCEAIYWMNDTIHIITKNRSKRPEGSDRTRKMGWNRFPEDYIIPDVSGDYRAKHSEQNIPYLYKVKNRGIKDLVTAVDQYDGVIATLTYSELRILRLNGSGNSLSVDNGWETIHFNKLEQREGMVIISEGKIAVASEKHPLLGGPFLSIFTVK